MISALKLWALFAAYLSVIGCAPCTRINNCFSCRIVGADEYCLTPNVGYYMPISSTKETNPLPCTSAGPELENCDICRYQQYGINGASFVICRACKHGYILRQTSSSSYCEKLQPKQLQHTLVSTFYNKNTNARNKCTDYESRDLSLQNCDYCQWDQNTLKCQLCLPGFIANQPENGAACGSEYQKVIKLN